MSQSTFQSNWGLLITVHNRYYLWHWTRYYGLINCFYPCACFQDTRNFWIWVMTNLSYVLLLGVVRSVLTTSCIISVPFSFLCCMCVSSPRWQKVCCDFNFNSASPMKIIWLSTNINMRWPWSLVQQGMTVSLLLVSCARRLLDKFRHQSLSGGLGDVGLLWFYIKLPTSLAACESRLVCMTDL